jgi:large subunit ribosomal protein L10
MPTERKRLLVAQIRERLSRSGIVILTDYRGLSVQSITNLRREVEKAGGGYHVVKNTLFLLALEETDIAGLESYLEGPVAVAFGYENPISVAKAVKDYASDSSFLEVKAAWMDGNVLEPDRFKALAELPPRPILLGQLMGTIQSPITNLAGGLMTALQQLVYILKTRGEQGEPVAAESA